MTTKKSIFFSVIFSSILILSHYQSFSSEFSLADSLFSERKYSKSLEAYEALFQNGYFSDAMLLKMSYMHERVGRYEDALYYLSVYQQYNFSEQVQKKINALASEHQLSGYSSNDTEKVFVWFKLYKQTIVNLLLLVSGILLMMMAYQAKKHNKRPFVSGLAFSVLLTGVFIMSNYLDVSDKAIIHQSNTILMKGPSAASGSIEVLQKGHRVSILDESDAWTKILWDGEPAYLRNDKLRKI